MARANRKATTSRGTAEQIVSGAIGAAEALTVGVVQMTGRTLIETLHAVEEIGSELGSAAVRVARGSIKAAEDIGSDLVTVGSNGSAITLPVRVNRRLRDGIARVALEHANGVRGVVEVAKAEAEVPA